MSDELLLTPIPVGEAQPRVMFWEGDGFPGGHMTSFATPAWRYPCKRNLPSGKPFYGRQCARHVEIDEVADHFLDGTVETYYRRTGCGYCHRDVDATREVDGDWQLFSDDDEPR